MKIVYSAEKEISKGDYNASVDAEGALVLPASLKRFNATCGVYNAESFFSISSDCPSAVMAYCEWNREDVAAATEKLRTQLRGFVIDALLDPITERLQFKFGAMIPPGAVTPQAPELPRRPKQGPKR